MPAKELFLRCKIDLRGVPELLKEVQNIFKSEIADEFGKRYGVKEGGLISCGGFESFVYSYSDLSNDYIMKITHSTIKDEKQILSEIDFVNYLHKNGVPVSQAVPSAFDRYLEKIETENGCFYARSYQKAEGTRPSEMQWNTVLFRHYGETLGQIHKFSKTYKPQYEQFFRPQWNENDRLKPKRNLLDMDMAVLEKAREIVSYLSLLPKTTDNYGIIHNDFHSSNFFLKDGKITLFDFDDMEYSWFASDIAIVLYYALYWKPRGIESPDYPQKFFDAFMEGYSLQNRVDDSIMKHIPYFAKFRHVLMYLALSEAFDLNNLQKREQELLNKLQREIEENKDLIGLNF